MKAKINQAQLAEFILKSEPENWPTVDEFPEADVSDLVRTFEATVEPES